jgi:hypothetical protein
VVIRITTYRKEHLYEPTEVYRHGRPPGNDLGCVMDSRGKLIMESILETKAATILEFLQGLRGSLSVTFKEGTSAAWLHDLLKPHVARVVVCDPRRTPLLPLFGLGFAGYDGGGIKRGVRVGGHVLRRRGRPWSSLGESRDGGKNEDRKLESE